MSYKILREETASLRDYLNKSVEIIPADAEIQVSLSEPTEHETPSVYSAMQKVEPKNSRVKAAYVDRATQGSTSFVFVIEELDRGDDFHGRAAIVCKHGGKLFYAGASFPQRSKSAIPPNLYKMIPVRGSSMPSWVKPYADSRTETAD